MRHGVLDVPEAVSVGAFADDDSDWRAVDPENIIWPNTPIGPIPSLESLTILDAYFQWRRTPEGEASAK